MSVSCIVVSAGKGKRLAGRIEKPFVKVEGKPIIIHTLRALSKGKGIDSIILVVSKSKLGLSKRLVNKYRLSKVKHIVPGGAERFDSVKKGLGVSAGENIILIHDGVRPFVDGSLIKRVITSAKRFGASIPAVPVKQTVKLIERNFFVSKTPKRTKLREVQTPQGFKNKIILEAYRKVNDRHATDDASLVEKLGRKVKVVEGSYKNIKITTPEDLALAGILLKVKRLRSANR